MSVKHALIVDDEAVSLTVMSRMFSAEGYDVQPAKSGREALQCLVARSFHVIASSHEITPISGLDLWGLVKNEPRHEAALFLLVTTSARARHLAAIHKELPVILCKPFSAAMLRYALSGKSDDSEQDYFEI